ncbi:cupin domain-containing protein [Candidatus Formimonas warabiya]|uniref:Cupin n=1 Tax=Formimonas warabiya TaxID=1761012 RepID=A0A3G1KRJ1_FORW1|nr:cupin domain-containing protein [Candidatus Formimonas warabiya]ATW24735.1 cupin [Candidatus Formimonas warabiya]
MQNYKIGKGSEDGYITVNEGIERKTMVYAEKTLLIEMRLKQGKTIPKHKHPHEQTGYLISGHIVMIVDEERNELKTGDSYCFKGNVEHSTEILEDSVLVEVFSPVREEYIV